MNGFINWAFHQAFKSGMYICHECGAIMHFEGDDHSVLVCDECGHSVDIDDYGMEDEDYSTLYPRNEDDEEENDDDEDW